MAFVTAIPVNDYPAGTRNIEVPVDDSVQEITVRASRNNWVDTGAEVIKVRVFLSLDDGATFAFHAAFGTKGGNAVDRLGNPITHSSMTVRLPTRQSFLRKIRVEEENTVTINTAIDFEVR